LNIYPLRKSGNELKTKREDVMDDNKSDASSRRLTRREEEELFAAIITGYLRDKVDLEIYPKGISIREKSNPGSREIFFPFDEDDDNGERPEYPED
jgi:hypothetical protein